LIPSYEVNIFAVTFLANPEHF